MTQTGGDETVPAVAKGRLVIAGSSDWDAIGRSAKDSKKTPGEVTSFPGFVVYTPAGGLEFVSVHTSCSSCHSICIDGVSLSVYTHDFLGERSARG